MSSELLTVSDLTFEVRRSSRRNTIGITVDRDGELIVHVPEGCQPPQVEQVVRKKQFWVYTKLATKALLAWPPRKPEYVPGEGFAYLGRWYRLRYVDAAADGAPEALPLRLFQGRFYLHRDAQATAHVHFRDWYTVHAQPWLTASVAEWNSRIGVEPCGIAVRDLGYRWASCGHSGTLHFNWRTIMLPPRIIEYVVAHELVHRQEPHHDAAFWRQLERAMPDYERRKHWLAEHGGQY
jgi:predicted metal-dependent hydrolase